MFREAIEGDNSELYEEAAKVNACRSQAKDFWRRMYLFLDHCRTLDADAGSLRAQASRYGRFRDQVERLDVLPGYDGDGKGTDPVYTVHDKLAKYYA